MASRTLRLALALSLVLVVATGCAWFFLRESSRAGKGVVRSVAEEFARSARSLLNATPQVTVDRVVILQETTPALELATTKRRFQHKMAWSSTRFHSTKTITLEGEFTATAGFDLREPFSAAFDSRTRSVRITHPRPRILSVQVESIHTTQEEGWWNAITDQDRSRVLSDFAAEARAHLVENPALLNEARASLRRQLEPLLAKTGLKVEFDEAPAPLP